MHWSFVSLYQKGQMIITFFISNRLECDYMYNNICHSVYFPELTHEFALPIVFTFGITRFPKGTSWQWRLKYFSAFSL